MEKFDLILESQFYKAKNVVLEEAADAETSQRYNIVLTEAAGALQKTKDFVVKNKGKLAALAAAGLAGYGAYKYKDQLGDLAGQLKDKVTNYSADKEEALKSANEGRDEQRKTIADLQKAKEAAQTKKLLDDAALSSARKRFRVKDNPGGYSDMGI